MPLYMEQGSKGPAVNLLLGFLDPTATKDAPGKTGIILDGELLTNGTRVLHEWQAANDLSTEGGFGPEGRAKALELGFDFEANANAIPRRGKGASTNELTAFVQLDGSILYWAAGISPTMDWGAAVAALYRSRHSN